METATITRFEAFCENYHNDPEKYRNDIRGNGGFEYREQASRLINLSGNMNYRLLEYLFGDRMALHYMQLFIDCNRDLLAFLRKVDDDKRFYILHELKTDENLFAHC